MVFFQQKFIVSQHSQVITRILLMSLMCPNYLYLLNCPTLIYLQKLNNEIR
ncbi:hypothetical protein P9112_013049 [Eukaryota sp. TZLM1-RC]